MPELLISNPNAIEAESFRIISAEIGDRQLDPENANVIKRVIHTTADFDYLDKLVFSPNAVTHTKAALLEGAHIVTDTKMGMAGINRAALQKTGSTVSCFIDTPEVISAAKESGSTRALAAVDYAAANVKPPLIFVVGNAPTALIRLHELVVSEAVKPALIVAVPVGFVNVVESKELIITLVDVPYIVARGRKGGSNVGAAIINALLYEAVAREL